jgi:hypothetical protein
LTMVEGVKRDESVVRSLDMLVAETFSIGISER